MNVDIKLTSNVDEVLKAFGDAVETALEAVGMQAQNYAVLNIEKPKPHKNGVVRPNVDTGRLVGSISHEQEGDRTEVIGTNVEYAPYVELGTQKTLAYPFLKPAVVDHKADYESIIRDCLQNG